MQKFAIAVVLVISFLLLLTNYGMGAEPQANESVTEATPADWEYSFSTLARSDGAAHVFAGVHYDWFTVTGGLYTDHLVENSLMGWMIHSNALPTFGDSNFYGGVRATLARLGPNSDLLWDVGGRIGVSNIMPEEGLAIAYLWLDVSVTEDLDVHPMFSGGLIVSKKEFQFGLELVGELYNSGSGAFDIWLGLREWTEDDKKGKWSIRVGALQDGGRVWWGRGTTGHSVHGWSGYLMITIRG